MIAAWLRGVCDTNRKRWVMTAQNPAYRLIRHFFNNHGISSPFLRLGRYPFTERANRRTTSTQKQREPLPQ